MAHRENLIPKNSVCVWGGEGDTQTTSSQCFFLGGGIRLTFLMAHHEDDSKKFPIFFCYFHKGAGGGNPT